MFILSNMHHAGYFNMKRKNSKFTLSVADTLKLSFSFLLQIIPPQKWPISRFKNGTAGKVSL